MCCQHEGKRYVYTYHALAIHYNIISCKYYTIINTSRTMAYGLYLAMEKSNPANNPPLTSHMPHLLQLTRW